MADAGEDPKLRAAYNAAVSKYGANSKQALAARTALGNQRASVGLPVNAGGIGVASPNSGTKTPSTTHTGDDVNSAGTHTVPISPTPTTTGTPVPAPTTPDTTTPAQAPVPQTPPAPPTTAANTALDIIQQGDQTAVKSNQINNPNYAGPLGTQTTTIDSVTGQPTVTNVASQGQQGAINSVQTAGQQAGSALGQIAGQFNGTVDPATGAYTTSLYNQLAGTGSANGLDATYQRNMAQLQQTLANRGIPVGSQAYDDQTKQLTDSYNTQKSQAQNQAVTGAQNIGVSALGALGSATQGGVLNPSSLQSGPFSGTQIGSPDSALASTFGTAQSGANNAATNATNTGIAQTGAQTALGVAAINATAKQPQTTVFSGPGTSPS